MHSALGPKPLGLVTCPVASPSPHNTFGSSKPLPWLGDWVCLPFHDAELPVLPTKRAEWEHLNQVIMVLLQHCLEQFWGPSACTEPAVSTLVAAAKPTVCMLY